MGCWKSKHANDETLQGANSTTDNELIRVFEPSRWVHSAGPARKPVVMYSSELKEMRERLWQSVADGIHEGEKEIWAALKVAAEGDLSVRQRIVEQYKLTLGGGLDLTTCYDQAGTRYSLPDYVLKEPENMDYKVLRAINA